MRPVLCCSQGRPELILFACEDSGMQGKEPEDRKFDFHLSACGGLKAEGSSHIDT